MKRGVLPKSWLQWPQWQRFTQKTALAAVGITLSLTGAMALTASIPVQAQTYDYAYFYRAGNEFYKQNKLTQAIEMYERAIPLAQGGSIPVVYNNLAAIYMRRGNYFLQKERQPQKALGDFQKAMYIMEYAWPEGLEYSANQSNNRRIAKQNLEIGYRNNKIPIRDTKLHQKMASDLRRDGKFHHAVVEYGQALVDKPNQHDVLMALGDVFNVLNRMHKAKKYYLQAKNTLSADKLDEQLWVRLAHVSYQAGDVDLALKLLNQVTDANPNNTRAVRQLEAIWRKDLQYDPNNPLAHANLASVFHKQGLHQKALRAYNNAERLAVKTSRISMTQKMEIRLNLGTLHQEMGNIPIATQAYQSVLEKDPNNQRALYLLAALHRQTGQPALALQHYHRLMALDPDNDMAQTDMLAMIKAIPNPNQQAQELSQFASRYADRASVQSTVGEAFHALGRTDDAIRYYEAALRLEPNRASDHANLGAAYREKGRESEALIHFKKAHELDPVNDTVAGLVKESESAVWQSLYRKAVEQQQAGDYPESIQSFQQVLASPGVTEAMLPVDFWLAYGLSYQQDKQLEPAIEQYDQAIKTSPEQGNGYYYRATVYHQKQVLGLAIRDYKAALDKPALDESYRTQAREAVSALEEAQVSDALTKAMEAYGKQSYTQALNLLSQAEKLSPSEASIYYYRGLVYNDQKKYSAAITQYKKALSFDSTLDDTHYALGIAYENNKQTALAKQSFQTYVKQKAGETSPYTEYAQSRIGAL